MCGEHTGMLCEGGLMSDFPKFYCRKLKCSRVSVECCIRRQVAQNQVHDRKKRVHLYDRYPDCPGEGEHICKQGILLMEKHPDVEAWARALKPVRPSQMLKRGELAYLEPRSAA